LRHSASVPIGDDLVDEWLTRVNNPSSYFSYFDQSIRDRQGDIAPERILATILNLQPTRENAVKVFYPLLWLSLWRSATLFQTALGFGIAILLYDTEIKKIDKICDKSCLELFYQYIVYVQRYHTELLRTFGLR